MAGSVEFPNSSDSTKFFVYCIAISLLLHLLFAFGVGWFFVYHPTLRSMVDAPPPKLTLTLSPQQLLPKQNTAAPKDRFAVTDNMREVSQSSPNAMFQSDHNTASTSVKKGIGDESLPELSGNKAPGLQLFDRTSSVVQKASQAGTPSPQTQQRQTSPNQSQQQQQAQQPQKQQTAQTQKPVMGTIPILPAQKSITQPTNDQRLLDKKPPPIKQPNMFQSGEQSTSAPAQAQFAAKKSDVRGGATLGKDDSLAAKKTLEGEYKAKIYKAIGSRWYAYIQNRISLLNVGGLQIAFEVNSNGKIQNIHVISGNEKSILADISRLSILETSGQFGPFSEELKKEVGDKIEMSVNFSLF
jgi:outer membrane biosynthesis protein TonB